MIDMKKTGEWLRYLCKRKNLTVADIQEKLKIASNQAIYAWFNGKTLPSLNNMYALGDLMGISVNDMIVDNIHEHPFLKSRTRQEKRVFTYAYRMILNLSKC